MSVAVFCLVLLLMVVKLFFMCCFVLIFLFLGMKVNMEYSCFLYMVMEVKMFL